MLNREQAQAELKRVHISNFDGRRKTAVADLPASLRAIAKPLVEPAPTWSINGKYDDWRRTRAQALDALDALKPDDRTKIWQALFFQLAPHVEAAWQMQKRLPYQTGRAFRASDSPHATLPLRAARLDQLLHLTRGYDQDLAWFAAWAPYLHAWGDALGLLFAAAIEQGDAQGQAVFDVLCASARNEHPIGAFGQHVARALLVASRPDGWALMEQLLLAAQRQEGLRQAILETIDLAHPQAFRRMLGIILEHDLARFSAALRALDVWLGLHWTQAKPRQVNVILSQLLTLLDTPAAQAQALAGGSAQDVYLALWTMAFHSAPQTIEPAAQLLREGLVERRFAAAYLLAQIGLPETVRALTGALEDADRRVVACAVQGLVRFEPELQAPDLFERLEHVLPGLPRGKTELKPIVWEWMTPILDTDAATDLLLTNLGSRLPQRLVPFLHGMNPLTRGRAVQLFADPDRRTPETRRLLLDLCGDASPHVRGAVLRVLNEQKITRGEAPVLETLLTRQSGDVRRGVLQLLLSQSDDATVSSVERLLKASNSDQRTAGLELAAHLTAQTRACAQVRDQVADYRARATRRTPDQEQWLSRLSQKPRRAPTLDNALGLLDPGERTPPVPPRPAETFRHRLHEDSLVSPASIAVLQALDSLIEAHRTVEITLELVRGSRQELLGNLTWGFPLPRTGEPSLQASNDLPLRELWEEWFAHRPPEQRDADGMELLRAVAAMPYRAQHDPATEPTWRQQALPRTRGKHDLSLRYPRLVHSLLSWLLYLHSPAGAPDFLLDAVEFTFAVIPADKWGQPDAGKTNPYSGDWRSDHELMVWLNLARQAAHLHPDRWTPAHHARLWGLLRWLDEPQVPPSALERVKRILKSNGSTVPPAGPTRLRASLLELLRALDAGAATEADLLDHLLGPRPMQAFYGFQFDSLYSLTARQRSPLFDQYPILDTIVPRVIERILEIELARGALPTAASLPALSIRCLRGAATFVRVLAALERGGLTRGRHAEQFSQARVWNHLLRTTIPAEDDTYFGFADIVRTARLDEQCLIQAAMFAPQWADHIEAALGWDGLADAVWWIYAHTKDSRWQVDRDLRDTWNALATERTPLMGQDLLDGAVDVEWFQRAYHALGAGRWKKVYDAAKFASAGAGHARAKLFADAMLGRVEPAAVRGRIAQKRNQDAVRALGLVPLQGTDDLSERYQVIQEFLRSSKQFGAQRRESEKRAAEIALANLARTAGYSDPLRLEWAMETRVLGDLANGARVHTFDGVKISLGVDDAGKPRLDVVRGNKPLKTIPAGLKKEALVVELQARKRELERQASRTRASLEAAMCRGDTFRPSEVEALFRNPLLKPVVSQLVWCTDESLGWLIAQGQALQTHDGQILPIPPDARLRLAHPYDFYIRREWHSWQRTCFAAERIQPFKQIFRELYLVTPAEAPDGRRSKRYTGHQVQSRQALALLAARGWVFQPDAGVRRTFHAENLSAWLTFNLGWLTPLEVEGHTLESVEFTGRGAWEPLPLQDIPPRLFSEVMRDVDLVVSVAHAGGVDPEASQSTVEMRASLLRETLAQLQIKNVEVKEPYAFVTGELGNYTVHLGSAVVHKQPGGALCIVPVHAQQRGRLFLPFEDADPRTAEVLSKVLLLAHDKRIQDPVILEQLLAL